MIMVNNSKLGKKISLCMFGMIFTIMLVLTIAVTSTIAKRTKDDAINDMKIITRERSQIIENYVKNAEKTLTYYSQAGEIADVLAQPNSLEAAKRAQSYTEKFSQD